MPRAINKGDMSKQSEVPPTACPVTGEGVRGGAATRPVAGGPRTALVVTPVHLQHGSVGGLKQDGFPHEV